MFKPNTTRLLILAAIYQRLLKGVSWLYREVVIRAVAAVRVPGGFCPP
ncbi:hypothetical protein [Thermocoleostomius sinensis]|uniref:Uncharacterized protein n=1 Tax=Thermocoleostomius sinensis A174 TaxID=2016057 RepID=A0A9E9C8J3_9CYAN|nr:hypothetical protein [Thermocoleostomius sinensis]WAL61474.1 hypothetical protein OXH18_05650 [Thermocoleostomius sinensis A174]